MATTSYGTITIIDVTDVGQFSIYPYANGPNTQIYSEETSEYTPDWDNSWDSCLRITPIATYAGVDHTSDATIRWYIKGSDTPISTSGNYRINGKDLLIKQNIPLNDSYVVYVVKADYVSETGAEVHAEGEITFNLLTQTSTVKDVRISGVNVIKYASESSTPSPSSVTLTANIVGANKTTFDGWEYYGSNGWTPVSGVSGLTTGTDASGNPTLTVEASYNNTKLYFATDVARFQATITSTSDNTDHYTDVFSVTQLRDGARGNANVTMDLTNDDQLVPINKEGVPQWSALGDLAGTTVSVKRGTTDITSSCTIQVALTNVTVEFYQDITNAATKYNGTWTSGNLPSGYYGVKVTGFTNGATTGSVRFSTTVDSLSYSKTFSLVGQVAGTDGQTPTIYSLEFPQGIPSYINTPTGSAEAQNLQDHFSYSPQNLVLQAYKIETDINGISTKSAYTPARVYYSPYWSNNTKQTGWTYIDLNNQGQGTIVADTAHLIQCSPITFRLVGGTSSNTTANIKDEETIVITSDGKIGNTGDDGQPAINLLLSNENITIAANNSGTIRTTSFTTVFQGYEGIEESNNFSYNSFSTSGGITVSSVTPTTNTNELLITLNSQQTFTQGQTGTITLTFKYTGTTPNITFDKTISWIAVRDTVDGKPAVYLTFDYNGSTFFKNETGSTIVTPVLLRDGTNVISSATSVSWTNIIDSSQSVPRDPSNNNNAKISATDISGTASFMCQVVYDGKTYKQYVSFTDYSDPLQVAVISTLGDKMTNSIGNGIVYPQTTQNGITLDRIANGVAVARASNSAPSSPAVGDFYFNTSSNKLFVCETAGTWTATTSYPAVFVINDANDPIVLRQLSGSTYPSSGYYSGLVYEWSFRDINGDVINPSELLERGLKVSYKDATHASTLGTDNNIIGGQFIYIDSAVVNNKIIIVVKVTKS